MTDFHKRCASQLADLLTAVADWRTEAQTDVSDARTALLSAPDLEPTTVELLLQDALAVPIAELDAAKARLSEIGHAAWLKKWWFTPHHVKEVARAKANLERKRQDEGQDEPTRERAAERDRRDRMHAAHEASKDALGRAQSTLASLKATEEAVRAVCRPLHRAIKARAWLAHDAEASLTSAVRYAQARQWEQLVSELESLKYQIPPSDPQLAKWADESSKLVSRLVTQRSGFSAIAAFPGLITPSLMLAKSRCRATAWAREVDLYEDPSDQWHALADCVLTHGALLEPAQWTIYWALLKESQKFAEGASRAIIHEDVLTGMLVQALKGQLEGTAKKRLMNLGYPSAKANLAFLQLAGLLGEFKTGADVGLVIQIDVGDLHVHKVALLQAKVSTDGNANIGSKPSGPLERTQLQKLTDAERDFFLFYHRTLGAAPSILPTVTSVDHFFSSGELTASDLLKTTVTVKPRLQGWDLASFVAFGMCTPANSIGKDVPLDTDPLEAMMSGGRDSLPAYMIVVTFGYDESGYHKIMTPLHEKGYRAVRGLGQNYDNQTRERVDPECDGPGI